MRLELKYPVDTVWSSSKGGVAAWWTFWGTGIGEGGGGLRRSSQWNNMKENALQFSNLLKKMNIGNNIKKTSSSIRNIKKNRPGKFHSIFFLFIYYLFVSEVSLCKLGYPGTFSVHQVGLKLTEIQLPLPPPNMGLKVHTTTLAPTPIQNLTL